MTSTSEVCRDRRGAVLPVPGRLGTQESQLLPPPPPPSPMEQSSVRGFPLLHSPLGTIWGLGTRGERATPAPTEDQNLRHPKKTSTPAPSEQESDHRCAAAGTTRRNVGSSASMRVWGGGRVPFEVDLRCVCLCVGGAIGAMSSNPRPPGMHWTGGRYPRPLQGAQPLPSHCLPEGKCQLQWHL